MYGVVWDNGRIALTKDLIFGLVVMTEDGWFPVSHLDDNDRELVWRLYDHTPGCPFKDNLAVACGKVKA